MVVNDSWCRLFYKYGFEESYLAVLRMDDQVIARTMRAVHRYASGALVVTTLLHAYRRSPR